MHVIFIPYGKRSEVDLLLRDMEAQKHLLKLTKDDQTNGVWIQSQIRILPFGIYEYICPREDLDTVLHTLDFDQNKYIGRSEFSNIRKFILRHLVNCEKAPKYNKEKNYLWIKPNVKIIPIGIRKDGDIIDDSGQFIGWKHEAI